MQPLEALLELLQVEAEVLLPAGEFLGVQQVHGLLGGLCVVRVGVVHRDALEDRGGGEEQAIAEGVLGVQAMAEDDVGDLEGEDRVQIAHLLRAVGGDDGGGVDQALGEDDGVADGERLKRLGEQRADADRAAGLNVVVDEDVVGEGFEGLVELAGRVEQAGLEEALDDVVLGLLHPLALGAERADIGCIVGDVLRVDDFERGVLGVVVRDLEDVAPDVVDGLELEGARRGSADRSLRRRRRWAARGRAGRWCASYRSGRTPSSSGWSRRSRR